jgi:hypothetical protein
MAMGKNWIEIILMPMVVAGVGIWGTHLITREQEQNAQIKAIADRQVKLLELFADKITSKDDSQRILALGLLKAMDGDLAAKLASAAVEAEPEGSKVRNFAAAAAAEATARARLSPRVYMHVQNDDDRPAVRKLSDLLEKQGVVVPGIQQVGSKAPKDTQLRYFRKTEKDEAQRIASILGSAAVRVTVNYISGYEDSNAIRPMHFEIWFSPGEPKMGGSA